MKKNVFTVIVFTLMTIFFLSGCVEHRYYHQNHQHSDGYNHRHHRTTSGSVDIHLHN